MSRSPVIAVLLALAAGTPGVSAAQSSVGLGVIGENTRRIRPGEVCPILLRASNGGTDTTTVAFGVDLPPGWSLPAGAAPLRLDPATTATQLLAIRAGGRAVSGSQPVQIHAVSSRGDTLSTATAVIEVLEIRSIEVVLASAPAIVPASEASRVRFLVRNGGNATEHVVLQAKNTLGFKLDIMPSSLVVGPFSAEEVVVTVRPGDTNGEPARNLVSLVADAGAPVAPSRAAATIDVLPRGRAGAAMGSPIQLGLTAAGATVGAVARQLVLDAPRLKLGPGIASVAIRGPGGGSLGPFSAQDLYQITYRSDRLIARLGDQHVRQTDLGSSGAPGFGAAVSSRIGRIETSVFAVRSRFGFPRRAREGFTVSLSPSSAWRFSMNGLAEQYMTPSAAAVVRAEWTPDPRSALHFEYGLGSYDRSGGSGVSIGLRRARPGYQVDLRYAFSSQAFPGSSRGSSQLGAAASVAAMRSVWADVSAGRNRRSSDFVRYAPAGSDDARVGLRTSGRLAAGIRYQAGIAAAGRRMISSSPELGRSEGYLSSSATLASGSASVRVAMDRGVSTINHVPQRFTKYDIILFMRFGRLTLSGDLTVEEGARVYFPLPGRRTRYGGGADLRATNDLKVRLEHSFSGTGGTMGFRSEYTEAEVEYRLPFGHLLAVRARRVRYASDVASRIDLAGGVAYRVPLHMPASRPWPRVSGRVLLAGSSTPVRDAVVTAGGKAVMTDEKGRFDFDSIRNGDRLAVETSLVDPTLVVANPEALELHEGRTGPVEILLSPGASIVGSFRIDTPAAEQTISQGRPEDLRSSGLVVRATSGSIERHTVTSPDGSYRLTGLAPGAWTLRASEGSLPAGFDPSAEGVLVEAVPGAVAHADVQVTLQVRAIRMVTRATLTLENQAGLPAGSRDDDRDHAEAAAGAGAEPRDHAPPVEPRRAFSGAEPATGQSRSGIASPRPGGAREARGGEERGVDEPGADSAAAPGAARVAEPGAQSAAAPGAAPGPAGDESIGTATGTRPGVVLGSLVSAAIVTVLLLAAAWAARRVRLRRRGRRLRLVPRRAEPLREPPAGAKRLPRSRRRPSPDPPRRAA